MGGNIRPPSIARSNTVAIPPVRLIPRMATNVIDAIITDACKTYFNNLSKKMAEILLLCFVNQLNKIFNKTKENKTKDIIQPTSVHTTALIPPSIV